MSACCKAFSRNLICCLMTLLHSSVGFAVNYLFAEQRSSNVQHSSRSEEAAHG